jgi:hypothetical protein
MMAVRVDLIVVSVGYMGKPGYVFRTTNGLQQYCRIVTRPCAMSIRRSNCVVGYLSSVIIVYDKKIVDTKGT